MNILFENTSEIIGFSRRCRINFINNEYTLLKDTVKIKNSNYSQLRYQSPYLISNAIFHISNKDISEKIFQFLEYILVPHILCIDSISKKIEELVCFIELFSSFGFHKSTILLPFREDFYDDKIIDVFKTTNRIEKIVFYNSPEDINIENRIWFLSRGINSFNRGKHDFVCNITLFTESQAHHTYFNRKLYIGPNGEIKNAPECEDSFGYIQDLENPEQLKAIVQTPEFQKYWFVHKEITDVCKDCEFRHMCVDNRLPYQRAENQWYHKQECNYNPYIAKWKGEDGYRTLEECGVISNESGFSIDHEMIAAINLELWGEDEA